MARSPTNLRARRRCGPASGQPQPAPVAAAAVPATPLPAQATPDTITAPHLAPGPQASGAGRPILQIGLLGLGVVGSAVYAMLQHNAARLAERTGAQLVVRRVLVRDLLKPRSAQVAANLLTTDPAVILADPEIDLVVEVMGGLHPAREIVLAALSSGKSVICANKELMAEHSQELLTLAAAQGVDLYCEASVGGGIPILRPLQETLSAGRLHRVLGIVNGTTNYILSQMTATGRSLAVCLAEAQAAGYAEADPTADVAGHDAARKLAVLASIAFHTHVRPSDVFTEGINNIGPEDIQYASDSGRAIKLLACAERRAGGLEAWVQPCLMDRQHPLASVGGAFNAIYVEGDEVGQTMFFGQGAGGAPTASAVIGDLVMAAEHRLRGVSSSRPWARTVQPVGVAGSESGRYYLRLLLGSAQPIGAHGDAAAPAADLAQSLQAGGVPLAVVHVAAGLVQAETETVTRATLNQAIDRCHHLARLGVVLRLYGETNRSTP